MSDAEAIKFVKVIEEKRNLSLRSVAFRLDCSQDWVRDHLCEFPNWFRLPGAGEKGEIRIPAKDVAALEERQRATKGKAAK